MKKIKLFLQTSAFSTLVIVLMLTNFNSVSAHPSGVSCTPGSEVLGYWVDCSNHQANKTFTFALSGLDLSYSTITLDGAKKWSPTVNINHTTSIYTAQGIVTTYNDKDSPYVAVFTEYSSNSSGHLTSWKIKYNKHHMDPRTSAKNAITAAHEFGHAIGLNDLDNTANSAQLMYGTEARSATVPSTKDIKGANEATKN